MKNNYTILHLHTMLSNATTILDSVTNYKDYILKAKELGMTAIAFSEHGNIFEHLHKKEFCEKNGLKYIHGAEFYVTESLNEKIRDNFHLGMYALNVDGYYEINKLISKSFNRNDGSYFYSPRITLQDVYSTSDNIAITTACLGGVLYKAKENIKLEFIEFLKNNKHRCFLELQHHLDTSQIEYNKYLYDLHIATGIKLIVGTDTHAINDEHALGRKILQARKNIHFDEEDNWDIVFKSYDELVECYNNQKSIPFEAYMQAIENTNVLANMVSDFEIDRSFKYPKLSDNPSKDVKMKIAKAYKEKNISNKPNVDEYNKKIAYELDVFETQGMMDFLLLDSGIKDAMREENRFVGYSRGSVSGSVVAWLLGITEVDSIKYSLYFERFTSKARINLGDIDSDWSPKDRDRVKEYVHVDMKQKYDNLYTAEIVTFNTIALKGAWNDVMGGFRALKESGKLNNLVPEKEILSLEETMEYSKKLEEQEDEIKKNFPNIFKYVDMLRGVVVSVGSHPAGTIVSPIDIEKHYGTFTSATCEYPITMLNMKELDSLNAVKLDVLGLDNMEIINKGCRLANIDRLTPDNMDFDDENVWENIKKSPVGIFQFEQQFAHSLLKQALENNTNKSKLDIMSAVNGALRPSGASFRNELCQGLLKDNGCEPLNKLLETTNGFCIYQENILDFLHKFCGFSLGEADQVRRGIAKKVGTEQFIPKIKSGFIESMKQYDIDEERANEILESFLVVIDNASQYGFSLNHSQPYSMIGFACGYLRTYYPLEFLTVALEMNENNLEKSSTFLDYMNSFTNIKLKQPKFRYSTGEYFPNKEENIIYKGVGSIKSLNSKVGDELYSLRNNDYSTFLDLYKDIKEYTSCNSKQLDILIKLDYFSEFGESSTLLKIVELAQYLGKKQLSIAKLDSIPFDYDLIIKHSTKQTEKTISQIDFESLILETISTLSVEPLSISERVQSSLDYLGYIDMQFECDPRYGYVTEIDSKKTLRVTVYSLGNGKTTTYRIDKSIIGDLKVGGIVYLYKVQKKPKWTVDGTKPNGKPNFKMHPTDTEWHIVNYERKSEYEFRKSPYPNAENE